MNESPYKALPGKTIFQGGWLVLLAFASGTPYGIVQEFIPLYLKDSGVGLKEIGLATLLSLPWSIKALWAPLVDRIGSRRSWILGGLLVAAVATGLIGLVPVGGLAAGLILLVALGSATQDIAIDGTVASSVTPETAGRANGIRVAAYRASLALSGGAAVVVGAQVGWLWGLLLLGIVQGLLAGLVLLLAPDSRPAEIAHAEWGKELLTWLKEPGSWLLFGMALLFKLGDAAMAPMIKTYWVDSHLSLEEVALFSTTFGTALTAVGALCGGELMSRLSPGRGILLLGLAQALSNLGYAASAWLGASRTSIYLASVGESFSSGLGTAALLSAFTLASSGNQAATRFAILTAIVGLTRTLSGAVSGGGVEAWGYSGWFAVTFGLSLPGLLIGVWGGLRLKDVYAAYSNSGRA